MPAEEKKKDAKAKWRRVKVCLPALEGAKTLARTGPKEPLRVFVRVAKHVSKVGRWWPASTLQERAEQIGSRSPRASTTNQTPAPGSQPRENKKAKYLGGKGSVAQWWARWPSGLKVVSLAPCGVEYDFKIIGCLAQRASLGLSQSHHAGFANTHAHIQTGLKTLLWQNLPFPLPTKLHV